MKLLGQNCCAVQEGHLQKAYPYAYQAAVCCLETDIRNDCYHLFLRKKLHLRIQPAVN